MSLAVAVAIIIVGVGIGWENNKVIPLNSSPSAHYSLEPHNRLSFLANWDGPIYLSIAQKGYTSAINANFFPLYPLLIHGAHYIVRSYIMSGLLVSWASLVGAIYFYFKIIKRLYGINDNLEALRGALFFILFPTAVFLLVTYTESLFAFLSLGAIYYALRKNYLIAGLFTLLCTATHVNGLFVLILVSLLLLSEGVKALKVAAGTAIGSLGIVSYMVYQSIKFHTPKAFLAAQQRHSWFNFSIHHIASEFATLNGMFLVLLLLSVAYWWRRRKAFAVYSLLYVCIVFIGGRDLSGIGRYSLMAFPLQFMLYDYFKDKNLGYALVLSLSSILWTFFTLHYVGGYTGG